MEGLIKRRISVVCVQETVMYWTVTSFSEAKYRKINSTKSHDSGAGNVSEQGLMSQSGRVREFMCALINQYVSAVRAAEVPVI